MYFIHCHTECIARIILKKLWHLTELFCRCSGGVNDACTVVYVIGFAHIKSSEHPSKCKKWRIFHAKPIRPKTRLDEGGGGGEFRYVRLTIVYSPACHIYTKYI